MRSVGTLAISDELDRVLRTCRALAERAKRRGEAGTSFLPENSPHLSIRAVNHVEAELGTVLPDDFWAVVAYGIPVFAAEGIASTMPHGVPATPSALAEVLLETASDAEGVVPEGLVAIGNHTNVFDTPEGPSYDHLCVRRGVRYDARNEQEVVMAGARGLRSSPSFATFLGERLVAGFGEIPPSERSSFPLVELVQEGETARDAHGMRVTHSKYGLGTIVRVVGDGEHRKLEIDFEKHGRKLVLARFIERS